MTGTLRERLLGAWKLVSYQDIPVDGSPPLEPLGHEPHGIIMYTSDGYMSAQVCRPNRPNYTSGDWFTGTDQDYRHAASTYIAYSGHFHVDEANQTLTHSMFVSLFPDWTGQTQPRVVTLKGDELTLGPATPIQSGGKTVNSVLTWRRADPN